MRKFFIILSFIIICNFANAQQIGMYSHYFYKPMVYNPAFSADGDASNAMLISRAQWTGFKENPKLTIFTLDGSLIAKKAGLGLILLSDKKGISTRTGGSLSYSYRIKINEDMHMLFGISAGIIDQTLNFSKAVVENNADQTLFSDAQHKTSFDGNAGLVFVWKELEFGAAIPQIIGNKVNYVDNTNVREYYTQVRHYMTSLKYHYIISKEKGISIAPQALIRFVPNTPFQFDGTVNLDWKGKFWIGTTYKSGYAVAANVGLCVYKQLYLGYSYDFIIGNIGKYSGMSHEIMINYKFGTNKKNQAVSDTVSDVQNKALVPPVDKKPEVEKETNKVLMPPVNNKTETQTETVEQKEARMMAEKDKADHLSALQAKINESEENIRDLKEEIRRASANDSVPALPPLNEVLIHQLQKKIEDMLDNPKSTLAEIQEIRNDIAAFLDSDIPNASTNASVKKNYELLSKPPAEDAPSVMVKGNIVFEGSETLNNYSIAGITVTDKVSGQLVGTYTPNAKTGLYLFILNPGKKYLITVKTKGYQTYSEDFTPENKTESYEMSKEIRLKKE